MKIGDRFQRNSTGEIFEIVSLNISFRGYNCINIETGKSKLWYFAFSDMWTYLGNYAKSDKFTELYSLMNS